MTKAVAVARMQLVTKWTYLGNPLVILAAAFLLSIAIFALIPVDEAKYGGGSQAPFWYFMVLGIQSMTLALPFSQALSISRRAPSGQPAAGASTGTTGMLVSLIGSAVLLLGMVALATLNHWGGIGFWFVQQTPLTIGAWAAALCVVLDGGSYLTLRRAIP